MAAAAAALLRRSRSSAASFVTRVVLLGVPGVHLVDVVHGHARHRLAAGQRLRQLDLQRVDAGDVMHDDADLAPVPGDAGLPLRVGEGAREGGQRAGPLLEAIGKGVGAPAGRGERSGLTAGSCETTLVMDLSFRYPPAPHCPACPYPTATVRRRSHAQASDLSSRPSANDADLLQRPNWMPARPAHGVPA